MTLTAAEQSLLLHSHKRECQVRYWLFAAPSLSVVNIPNGNISLSATQYPIAQISPRYALLEPGETVTLYGGDSYERGGGPASLHTWALVSGTAVLTPVGSTCDVTPQVPDEVVTVSLTVTATNTQTYTTYAYVVASADGWNKPTSRLSINGGYDAGGWKGRLELIGHDLDVSEIGVDKLLLIHIRTLYDNAINTMGGYKRANNLCLLRIEDWEYDEEHTTGQAKTILNLSPPNQEVVETGYYFAPTITDGAERVLIFEKGSGGSFNYDEDGNGDDGIAYISDFRLTDAALWIAAASGLSQYHNVVVFHDPNQFGSAGSYVLPIDSIWSQLESTMESILCLAFVDYMGTIRLIPSPAIRADEWWGTPSPRFAQAAPLTAAYVLDYKIHYNRTRADKVVLKGYNDQALPVTVQATRAGAIANYRTRLVETYDGYILTNTTAAGQWADDLLAMLNRDWDLTVTVACPGNVWNVGDFTYVDFDPTQPGQTSATGLAYVNAISHDIDHTTNMQITTLHFVQVTNWT